MMRVSHDARRRLTALAGALVLWVLLSPPTAPDASRLPPPPTGQLAE